MKEEKIKELLNIIFGATYRSDSYNLEIISKQHRDKIEVLVRGFLLDNRDSDIATLQAKVFMYEEIIKKSNFAPMIENNKVSVPPLRDTNTYIDNGIKKPVFPKER